MTTIPPSRSGTEPVFTERKSSTIAENADQEIYFYRADYCNGILFL